MVVKLLRERWPRIASNKHYRDIAGRGVFEKVGYGRVLGFMGLLLLAGLAGTAAFGQDNPTLPEDMRAIPAGSYTLLYREQGVARRVAVAGFWLDRYPVTNQQFAEFVELFPEWSPAQVAPIFADSQYLGQWQGKSMAGMAQQPVTQVSWFAAQAYCAAQGKRLPRLDEWEYAGAASATQPDGRGDPEFQQRLLQWYSRPAIERLPDVQDSDANFWGVHGMHGLIWEWVDDFNQNLVTGESRGDSELDAQMYCGAGAASAVDPGDYAAFMRYAMRSSLEGTYTMRTLGFRCAQSAGEGANQ
jgi:sulfatase modifying factor 1